jgi:pyruvate kinase
VAVPDVVIPMSPLTPKDREDLAFALRLGVDWIALSFVQAPEDMAELRRIVEGRAAVLAKIEKPQALLCLGAIMDLCDGVMVARGDLGVEMAPEEVPVAQKVILRAARERGIPVIVATQMLESMTSSPTPTRAEASDVANAVYEGADAVMLSAESAAGDYPEESVAMMNRIIERVERDPRWPELMQAEQPTTTTTPTSWWSPPPAPPRPGRPSAWWPSPPPARRPVAWPASGRYSPSWRCRPRSTPCVA